MASEHSCNHSEEWLAESGGLWPDGWYVYREGGVAGPFAAAELFPDRPAGDAAKASCLVSRKGFRSWYDYRVLFELYLKQRAIPKTSALSAKATPVRRQLRGPVLLSSSAVGKRTPVGMKLQASMQANSEAVASWDSVPSGVPATAAGPNDFVVAPTPSYSYAYHHMVLRGRLRLGNKVNPWLTAFVLIPATLGLHWRSWFEQALIAAIYHLDDPCANDRLDRLWQASVPFLHMRAVYHLAKLILQMEVQNQYRRTSPSLAFVLALCPPLAAFYLQSALNEHWVRHVRYQVSQEGHRATPCPS